MKLTKNAHIDWVVCAEHVKAKPIRRLVVIIKDASEEPRFLALRVYAILANNGSYRIKFQNWI